MDPLLSLQFVDDALLVARSKSEVANIIFDLDREAKPYGLLLHTGKTIICTIAMTQRPTTLKCVQMQLKVMKMDACEMYLGLHVGFTNHHSNDLAHRLSYGWGAFFQFRQVLFNKRCTLRARLKPFNAIVKPCVLYGCSSGTPFSEDERRLRRTQRQMLRKIIGISRKQWRDWLEYVIRCTNRTSNPFNMDEEVIVLATLVLLLFFSKAPASS